MNGVDGMKYVDIDKKSSQPLYLQIEFQVKKKLLAGELKAGEQLPSIRALAKELDVSVITVKKAYKLLSSQGLLTVVEGKGCYLSQLYTFEEQEQQKHIRAFEMNMTEAVRSAKNAGFSIRTVEYILEQYWNKL